MAVADQSDARGNTQFMVRTAQRCIEGELEARTHRLVLNKIYRLLNAYRSHGFAGYEYEPRSHRGPEALTLMPTGDQRVRLVAVALEEALSDTFGDLEREHVFHTLDQVIFATANSDAGAIADADRTDTLRFLGSFATHLQPEG